MAGDADSSSDLEAQPPKPWARDLNDAAVSGVIDPSSSYTHKLICLPDADTQPRGSASRSGANPSSNSVIVVDNSDRKIDSSEMSGCLRMARSFSMDDDILSDIFFETDCLPHSGGFLERTAASSTPTPIEDYTMSFCRPESATPSSLLDFESRGDDDDSLFPDLADPVADDEELVDLIIEQATLLSKTILRYLMVMI